MFPLEGTGPLGPLLPEHISEFVVGIILFFIILIVIRKVVAPRFEKMYSERAEAIRGGIERADKAQEQAQEALTQYQAKLSGAEDEAAQIREKAKQASAQASAESADKAQKEAERIVANARAQVEADKAHVADELRKDIGSMATVLAGKIVGESLDDDARARKTVDDFLVSLEKEPS